MKVSRTKRILRSNTDRRRQNKGGRTALRSKAKVAQKHQSMKDMLYEQHGANKVPALGSAKTRMSGENAKRGSQMRSGSRSCQRETTPAAIKKDIVEGKKGDVKITWKAWKTCLCEARNMSLPSRQV